jgi:hypothetical protein
MSEHRKRFNKIIAVAINPGAYEDEAIAALRRARALVKEDPKLAYPEAQASAPKPASPDDTSYQSQISNITAFLLPIIMTNLSAEAYGLGLKSKIEVEFKKGAALYTLNVRCDGLRDACEAFRVHLQRLINYQNTQPWPE